MDCCKLCRGLNTKYSAIPKIDEFKVDNLVAGNTEGSPFLISLL